MGNHFFYKKYSYKMGNDFFYREYNYDTGNEDGDKKIWRRWGQNLLQLNLISELPEKGLRGSYTKKFQRPSIERK